MMLPSVLLFPGGDQQTSDAVNFAAPVASTSAVPYSPEVETIHCSQCHRDLPLSKFPTRLINLQPYQVCLTHEWYWTEAKRALHWAPDQTSTLRAVCDAFTQIANDDGEFEDRFMVDAEEADVAQIVEDLARAGDWKVKTMTPRASRAKLAPGDPPPPPSWLYGFRKQSDPKKVIRFRLSLWYHRRQRKFTMTLKREVKKDRSQRPWARPERVKQQAIQHMQGESGEAERTIPPLPAAPSTAPTSAGSKRHRSPHVKVSEPILSNAQRDAQQMPPPPIPPRKKIRRVEPSLVSVPLPLAPAVLSQPSSPQSLLPANTVSYPDALAQLQKTWSDEASSLKLPNPPASFQGTSSKSSMTSSAIPYASSSVLTLFEMLNMPDFDPPIIPLPPRNPRPTTSSAPQGTRRTTSNQPAIRRHGAPQTRKAVARTGEESEEAVANVAGHRRSTRYKTGTSENSCPEAEEDLGRSAGEDEEDDAGDYEDSIPDDSSQDGSEDDEAMGQSGEEDEDDSSFFESSTEEYSDQGSAGEMEEESGVDWFTGFITKQMPGMSNGGEDDEDEDDGEVEAEGQPGSTSKNRRGTSVEGHAHHSTASSRVSESSRVGRDNRAPIICDEDEVDELESSDEE